MMVATAAQMKELDRQAIEKYGIPSLDLMEHAAQAVANAVWNLVGREDEDDGVIGGADGPIAVLVGGPDREEARREQERLQNLANALAEEDWRELWEPAQELALYPSKEAAARAVELVPLSELLPKDWKGAEER